MIKVLKILGISLLVLIGLWLIAALFAPNSYHVERDIVVNRPVSEVYDYARFLKNQDEYSVWTDIDPKMKRHFRGTDGTVGFVSGWDSENDEAGAGEQEIVKMDSLNRIDYALRFSRPFESQMNAFMAFEAIGPDQTKVRWGAFGDIPYPMNAMALLMDMEDMIGDDYAQGLKRMRDNLEGQSTP